MNDHRLDHPAFQTRDKRPASSRSGLPDGPQRAARVLKCSTTADFLAALPRLIGYTAEDSLFVVFFEGSRTGQAMRIDLPSDESPEQVTPLLDFVCGIMREVRDSEHSAPAVAITCTRTFAEADGPPWQTLARRIERRFEQEGFGLRELCLLAPDGWIGFLDASAPQIARSLAEIRESPIALEASIEDFAPQRLSEIGALPEPAPGRAAEVKAALERIPPFEHADAPARAAAADRRLEPTGPAGRTGTATRFPGEQQLPRCPHSPGNPPLRGAADDLGGGALMGGDVLRLGCDLEVLEHDLPRRRASFIACNDCVEEAEWMLLPFDRIRAVREADGPLDADDTAGLIRSAAHSDHWLVMALGVLTRPEFPCELAMEFGPRRFIGLPIDIDIDIDGGGGAGAGDGGSGKSSNGGSGASQDGARRGSGAAFGLRPTHHGWSVRRMLASICPDFEDHERLPPLCDRLLEALAVCPEPLRPGLYAFSAWLWWLRGSQTVAERHLRAARAIDPEHELSRMVLRLMRTVPYGRFTSRGLRAAA